MLLLRDSLYTLNVQTFADEAIREIILFSVHKLSRMRGLCFFRVHKLSQRVNFEIL